MQIEGAFIRHIRSHDIDVAGIIHQLDEIRDILHLAGWKEMLMCDIHHMACDAEAYLEAIEGWQHMDIRSFLAGRILQHFVDGTLERRHIDIHVPLLRGTFLPIVRHIVELQEAHAKILFFAEQELDPLVQFLLKDGTLLEGLIGIGYKDEPVIHHLDGQDVIAGCLIRRDLFQDFRLDVHV